MSWQRGLTGDEVREGWRAHARESLVDVNDGIVAAAGIAEGFARAGAGSRTLLMAGLVVMLTGGLAAAGARFTEERTEWEMNRSLVEAERASIEADPEAELEELVQIYESKGLTGQLARQVAEALTAQDPVAAHADAELRLDRFESPLASLYAALTAGLCFAFGAALPLAMIVAVPVSERIELTFVTVLVALALTGWFASWLTGLPVLRLVLRNLLLGAATMAAGLVIGLIVGI